MQEIQAKLKYSFRDINLLETALTHSSYANEKKCLSYERLEFVGDSVLGMIVATWLYRQYPDMPEGKMTKLRAELVCEQSLWHIADKLHLGEKMRFGRGEEQTGGRNRHSILADCVEAIIAALYIDGGMEKAESFVNEFVLADAGNGNLVSSDYKTQLQELIQQKPAQTITYSKVSESGPDHNKSFEYEVLINGSSIGRGSGHTRKEAEQNAAKFALQGLKNYDAF